MDLNNGESKVQYACYSKNRTCPGKDKMKKLEKDLLQLQMRYDTLCNVLKKGANDIRNY